MQEPGENRRFQRRHRPRRRLPDYSPSGHWVGRSRSICPCRKAERGRRAAGLTSRRQRLVPLRPACRHPQLDPAARHPWPPPRAWTRRGPARRSPRAGARQPQAGAVRGRPVGRQAPRPECSHLRRRCPACARTEARRLARPVARAELVAEPRTLCVPRIGRRPVSEVNTADVLEILTLIWHGKGGDGSRRAPAHPVGAGVGDRDGPEKRQPV